jgi:hypothetical protein
MLYVLFVCVCVSLFSEIIMFEQVVCLWIILSSHSCVVVSKQVNVVVVATV